MMVKHQNNLVIYTTPLSPLSGLIGVKGLVLSTQSTVRIVLHVSAHIG